MFIQDFFACQSIAEVVKSTLGPKGRDKLLLFSKEEYILTNDGATILSFLHTENAACNILIEASKSMERIVGDGTTSVALLTSSILKNLVFLTQKRVSMTKVVRGLHYGLEKCLEELERVSISFDLKEKEGLSFFENAIQTTLSSKFVSLSGETVFKLAVQCALETSSEISLFCVARGIISDSFVIKGNMFEISEQEESKCHLFEQKGECNCVWIQFCLHNQLEGEGSISLKEVDRMIRERQKFAKQLVVSLKKKKIGCVFVEKNIHVDSFVTEMLSKAKISFVHCFDESQLKEISFTNGMKMLASFSFTESPTFFKKVGSSRISTKRISTQTFLFVESEKSEKRCVLLRSITEASTKELRRAFEDAYEMACKLKSDKLVVGGGCTEILLHVFLKQLSEINASFSQVLLSLAESLLCIPQILAENGGLDKFAVVQQLKKNALEGRSNCGVSFKERNASSTTDEKGEGCFESLHSKKCQLQIAVETAISILKIDQTMEMNASEF